MQFRNIGRDFRVLRGLASDIDPIPLNHFINHGLGSIVFWLIKKDSTSLEKTMPFSRELR